MLSNRPIGSTLSEKGFLCEHCGAWVAVLLTNALLEEALRKLERYPPESMKFRFFFGKTLRRIKSIQKRGEAHGSFERTHMAVS